MPLSPKTRLGTYEIIGHLGAGGMGEVYRAKDLRLGREVAVKVLPATVAATTDRLARFEREARTVAGLNHPNIVTLFSVEDEDGVRFLTLRAERIAELDEEGTLVRSDVQAREVAHGSRVPGIRDRVGTELIA
jgi:serine/threonine protein kinase